MKIEKWCSLKERMKGSSFQQTYIQAIKLCQSIKEGDAFDRMSEGAGSRDLIFE